MKKTLLTLLLTSYVFSSIAQQINSAKLDSLFNAIALNNKGMGSLTLSQNGKVIYQKAMGQSWIATSGKSVRATVNTRYRIGSITKMFTAVMIFQLIEENKLNLNTSLNKFYPQLPNADKLPLE